MASVFEGLARDESLRAVLATTPEAVPMVERRMLGLAALLFGPADLTGASFTGAGYGVGGLTGGSFGWAYWIETVIVASNKNLIINLSTGTMSGAGTGTPPTTGIQMITQANVPMVIPMRMLVRNGVMSPLTAWIKEIIDTDKTGVRVSIGATGFSFADDVDMAAPLKILAIGDSLWAGSGPSSKETFLPWKIRRYFTDKGQRLRLVNGAIPGSTTQGHEFLRQAGIYDHDRVGLIIYQLGTNNAAQSIAPAQAQNDLATFLAWKKLRWPDAKMIVFGPPPAENNTTETNLVAIRTALSDAVTAAADSTVKYKSLAGAFDRTAGTAVYISTDTAGSRLHPNDAGINAEWNGGYNGFVGIKSWLDTNMPTV